MGNSSSAGVDDGSSDNGEICQDIDDGSSDNDEIGQGVNSGDILEDVRTIDQACVVGQLESGSVDRSVDIGSRLNYWQKPVTEWGYNPPGWTDTLKRSPYIGNLDFGRKEWARARDTVNAVLKLMLKEILIGAEKYEGLKIEKYYRQGSSREGLKVIAPDEFDTVLQFHIVGIEPEVVYLQQDGKNIPELCRLEVQNGISISRIASRYPKLHKEGVFEETPDGTVSLNARALHQAVFQSIIDQVAGRVMAQIKQAMRETTEVNFKITRSMNPPSVNITIEYDDEVDNYFMPQGELANRAKDLRKIDVDIVPALRIRKDPVPDPCYRGQTMDCPVYAVFKWMEESSVRSTVFSKPDIIWRVCSSGYEKHTMDLARSDFRQRLIITALRILKTYFLKTKKDNPLPPQIATVLRSYHLKHIAFYIIMYLGYIHKDEPIEGVSDVLKLFVAFLRISLENKCIPHFFHSNSSIRVLYPWYPIKSNDLRYNLLRSKTKESMNQALLSLDNHLIPELGLKVDSAQPNKYADIGKQYVKDVAKFTANRFMTETDDAAMTRATVPSEGARGTTRKFEDPGQNILGDILEYSFKHLGTKVDEAFNHMMANLNTSNKEDSCDDSEDEPVQVAREISSKPTNQLFEIVEQYKLSLKSGEYF